MELREDLKENRRQHQEQRRRGLHRDAAEAEREGLELDEDKMTPAQQAGSVGRELEHEVLADVDQTKGTIPNSTKGTIRNKTWQPLSDRRNQARAPRLDICRNAWSARSAH